VVRNLVPATAISAGLALLSPRDTRAFELAGASDALDDRTGSAQASADLSKAPEVSSRRKEVYYLKRQKRYGHGSTGSFVCQNEARAGGFRRSLLGIR
jgi:hypothetical protein